MSSRAAVGHHTHSGPELQAVDAEAAREGSMDAQGSPAWLLACLPSGSASLQVPYGTMHSPAGLQQPPTIS